MPWKATGPGMAYTNGSLRTVDHWLYKDNKSDRVVTYITLNG